MSSKEITQKKLREKIAEDKLTIVDFYADWCGPCRQLAPILESVEGESKGEFELYKVNVDDEEFQEFTSENMIMSIPTVHFYKNGKLVHSFVGLQDKESIQEMIASVR
jgi:thioredoxin 1